MITLFGHSVRSDLLGLHVADALLCMAAVGALLAWQGGVSWGQGGTLALVAAGACVLFSGISGLYRPEAFGRTRQILVGSLAAGMLLLLAVALPAMLTLSGDERLGDHLVGILTASVGAVLTTRLGFTVALRRGVLDRHLAVVRGATGGEPLRSAPALRDGRFKVALDLDAAAPLAAALEPARLRAARICAVVLTEQAEMPQELRRDVEAAGIHVLNEDEFLERAFARVDIRRLAPGWLASSNASRETRGEVLLRRSIDIVLGLLLLLATLPLLLLTALAIKLDSRGPVFYRQERVGRDGQIFRLLKFRSMVVDAEVGGSPVWASKADPRVTRVGRLIRLTRIDEIPQVLNVLRGDMAFVGPRPERPAFVEQLSRVIPHYADRAIVKPGITGWAQVNYPYGASVEDARMKLAYDLYYVRRRSLFLDLLILIATVRVVLFQEGSR